MSCSTIASWMRRRMSEISWLARSDIALSFLPRSGVLVVVGGHRLGRVDGVGMARQRRDADVEIGEQRKPGEQLVQLVDGVDVQHADVGEQAGDAPEVRPAPIALDRLRVRALPGLQLVGLLGRHVGREADLHLGPEQHRPTTRSRCIRSSSISMPRPATSGTAARPSRIAGGRTTTSSARSRKFVNSAGRPAVAAKAAAKATVASAPPPPSYWLPTTAGVLRARQRSRIRRDSVKPVRAVLMLTARTAPSSSARST